jgi:heptosyltransferase I
MQSSNPSPNSICILRLSAIGDVCHAVATVQAIQKQWPNCKITWVIGKIEAQLLTNMKNIEFVIFDKKAGLRGYRDLNRRLKGRKFDHLLHMQVALRASLATLCISAKKKWGFDSSRAKEGQWLFTNHQISPQTQPHVAEGFWGFAKAVGAGLDEKPSWQMPIAEADKHWSQQQTGSNHYFVISPAASKAERNWSNQNYAAIADYVASKGLTVVLSGGPSAMEKDLGEKIERLVKTPMINLIGKTNLPQLLALLDQASLVLAPDSGPAHMASSVNTPVIGIYAHSNPMRTGPYNSKSLTVSIYSELLQQQTGKSIEENIWGKRVKGPDLMSQISIEPVIEKVDMVLGGNK